MKAGKARAHAVQSECDDDLYAVRRSVFGVSAAPPVVPFDQRIPVGDGKEQDIRMLGVFPEYDSVRNLRVLAGRFFDANDEQQRSKVAVLQRKLALKVYDSARETIGNVLVLDGLPFTGIGVFEESIDTFGQSEVTEKAR